MAGSQQAPHEPWPVRGRASAGPRWGLLLLLAVGFVGCSRKPEPPAPPTLSAQALFSLASTNFHLPAAGAQGAEKARLLEQAAGAYLEVLRHYSNDAVWAAQALRHLGHVRAAQGRTNEAVEILASVETRYPQQRFEVLAALKAAGDLLWEAGRREEARVVYRRIVLLFDSPEATQVEQTIVRGARRRLEGGQ